MSLIEIIDKEIAAYRKMRKWVLRNAETIKDFNPYLVRYHDLPAVNMIPGDDQLDRSRDVARDLGGEWKRDDAASTGYYDYDQQNDGFTVSILCAEKKPTPKEPAVLVL